MHLSSLCNTYAYESEIQELANSKLPVVVLGTGSQGLDVMDLLEKNSISVTAFCETSAYYRPGKVIHGKPVYEYESLSRVFPPQSAENGYGCHVIFAASGEGVLDIWKTPSNTVKKHCFIQEGIQKEFERILSEKDSVLNQYGFKHGTDKASLFGPLSNIRLAHDYLRHYDFFFQHFREDHFTLVEFGCQRGNSLRMWEEYFPNADIYGVDIDEAARSSEKGRVHIVIGDATTQDTYNDLLTKIAPPPRVILDDASHAWGDQRRSFELFWDMLIPGGFYVVEDLECGTLGAYPQYPPKIQDVQPFSKYMQDRCEILRWAPDRAPRENVYHFEHLPEHIQKIEQEMDACTFIPGAVIVRKKSY